MGLGMEAACWSPPRWSARCRGYGSFYGFPSCDFRVHDTCAECPATFSLFGHPQYPLALYPVADPDSGRCCELCLLCDQGAHYGCRLCGVFLHPVCATLPPAAVSPAQPQHLVTLVPSTADVRERATCGDRYGAVDAEGWHYVCAPCGVRLHPWCLLGDGGEDDEDTPLCIRGPVTVTP
ncbi:hypothetical protein BAE44_0001624 [Dichanthelium oligosanthes]|uniref:DC1 domain-containing protein n=1 Tax=Dichanthelium oligosanthes TaxID=888268 RepID=A0A1E5WJ45_9POAL|nr:hypothetical protein BAE44_0001624 [Dichanthelium oligosanthes]